MMTKTTFRSILGVLWRILGMKRTIISRKEGQWFRSWNVMWYSFRNLLFEMRRLAGAFLLFFAIMIIGSNLPELMAEQYEQHWPQVWGLVLTAILAIIIYDQSRVANEKLEYDIRRNNNLMHLQYSNTYHGIDHTKSQIVFAVDEILIYVIYWFDDVRKWGKEKDNLSKKKIQSLCDDHWKAIQNYDKILIQNNEKYEKQFDKSIVQRINKISDACKDQPEFNYNENICKIEKLEVIVIQSLLLFKEWNIFTTNRFLAGWV